MEINSPDTVLDERNGVYMTSIPGSTRWFNSPNMESLSLDENLLLKGDKLRVVAHGQKEVGVVVKCYLGAENELKVCELVEVVGILEMPEDRSHEDEEDEPSSVVIHAITIAKKNLNDLVPGVGSLSQGTGPQHVTDEDDIKKAYELFIRHASSILEGDAIAARSLLLNLTSSLTHRNPVPLGSLPMNIYSLPPATVVALSSFLHSILPAVAVEQISIDTLNKKKIYPSSDGEALSAGRGQLVSRTALVIDESKMQEGKLLDAGMVTAQPL